jgi:N-methylhydantoinase A
VYDRERLPLDCSLRGPAVIEQMDTTTVVPPDGKLRNDGSGYLHMELRASEAQRSIAWAAA